MISGDENKQDTADITIRWKKPARYNSIKDKLKYEFELNSVEKHNDENYELKYRKVYEFSVVDMEGNARYNIEDDYIQITIPGDEIIDLNPPGGNSHPDYNPLKLNRIYFLRMKSYMDTHTESDYSIPVSFTTGIIQKPEVSLPEGLTTYGDIKETDTITLSWQPVDINWYKYNHSPDDLPKKIYYEISVSASSEREQYILSSGEEIYGNFETLIQGAYGNEDGSFPIIGDSDITFAKVAGQNLMTATVKNLLPNTAYYFIIRTRIEIEDTQYYSYYSNTHSEHTSRGDVIPPPDDERKLIVPNPDLFRISLDNEGNPLITSYTAQVEWEKAHKDDSYRLIWTQKPILPEETIQEILENNNVNGQVLGFKDDSKSLYTYNIGANEHEGEQLDANTQYYASIRAEREIDNEDINKEPQRKSNWITIPITTKVIESPTEFEILQDDSRNFDNYHWIKLKWKALDSDIYKFDIAVRPEDNDIPINKGYYVLSSDSSYISMEKVYKDNQSKPDGLDKNYNYFICTVKNLKPNTKYYAKVRIKDTETGALSKYTNVLSTRTEFSQKEYDDDEEDRKNDVVFQDRIKKFIDSYLWVYRNDSTYYNVKVRGDKAINYILNSTDNYFYINISQNDNKRANKKTVYIPYDVIELLDKTNKSLVIKTENGDFHYRPGFINDKADEIAYIKDRMKDGYYIREIFIQLNFENILSPSRYKPSNMELKSGISVLSAQVEGFNLTDNEIEYDINNKLYGSDGDGGIVREKKEDLIYASERFKDSPAELEKLIQRLLDEIEYEIGRYISYEFLENRNMKEVTRRINKTLTPILLNLNYDEKESYNQGYTSAYINIGSGNKWDKIESSLANGICSVNIHDFAKYAVLSSQSEIYDIGQGANAEDIRIIDSKYGILEALGAYGYFYPDQTITRKESIIILERILEETSRDFKQSDYIKRANELGIGEKLNLQQPDKGIERQEMAYLAVRLYEIKSGASIQHLNIPTSVNLVDERAIRSDLYKYAAFCKSYGFMIAPSNIFNPKGSLNRGEVVTIIKNVLEKLGEI